MGSLSNCVLLQLTVIAFSTILAQSQYPLPPLFQTLATLANLSDCWLCQHLDNAQEPELVFVPAHASTWWTHSGQWMHKREWYPQTRGHNHSTSSYGRVLWHWETSAEAQGLSLTQVSLLEGNFSVCIENKNGTGPFLGDVPKQYCNQTVWFDSTDGTFRPSIDVANESKTDYYDANVCLVTGQYSWFAGHTTGTWNSSPFPLVGLPNTQDYIWVDQNSGMTWLGNDTYLYSCQNQTKGLLYQIFRNLFCSYRLTEAHGKWRCADANITNDKGHGGHPMPAWWVIRSTLTLSVNNSGLFILCGNKVYKEFPPNWSGRCGLGYLAPSVSQYPAFNGSQITDVGSLIHKVAPHRRTQRDVIDHPPVYHNPNSLRALFSRLGTSDLEEAILNISKATEQGLTATVQTSEARQSRVSSLLSALQNHHLDLPAAQQGRPCTVVGNQCCLYVNKSKEVRFLLNSVKERIDSRRRMRELAFHWTDLVSGVRDWFSGHWGHMFGFVLLGFIIVLSCAAVRRSLTSRVPAQVSSSQHYTGLLACGTSCEVSNKETRGPAPPEGHKDSFALTASEQTAAAEGGLLQTSL
ncbi:endogenous retroviral envelope protein HEMO [Panthera leo]|uniref:endogenous retroviral envelope protein HEMO n=1 Tax=Panthera leo TaxID=9689 RepID=UPI001C6A270E|nr:endogenous retroviral envelope protein HEMO [Panthera leo]